MTRTVQSRLDAAKVSKEPYGALALGVGTSVLLAKRCGMRREVLVRLLRDSWNRLSRKAETTP